MPPFKAGLLKRKMDIPDEEKSPSKDASSEDESNEELFDGDLDGEGDSTDSEPGEEVDDSDGERDEVLYDDDDDDGVASINGVSSDTSTSQEASESGSDDESGIGKTQRNSSGEEEKDEEDSESESDDNKQKKEQRLDGKGTKLKMKHKKPIIALNGAKDDSEIGSDDESGIGQTQSNSSGEEEKDEEDSESESDDNKQKKGQKLYAKGTKLKMKHKKPIIALNGAKDDSESNTNEQTSESSDDENQEKSMIQQLKEKAKKGGKRSAKDKKATKNSVDMLADKIKETSVNIQPVEDKDEYESGDTSDEEDRRNTVGEVPAWWYNEYPHVGYDLDGRRILRPSQRDRIDDFLKQCEDPDFWRTVRDPTTGQDIVLSKQDLELIARIRQGQVPNADHEEYKPWIEWFTREVLATPIRAFPEHKRSFLPSRSEQQQISRIVHALKMGWTKTRKQIADERRKKKERVFYNLWGSTDKDEEEKLRGIHKHIPAPKRPLPSHAESYNPPPEYLLDAKEMKEWNKLSETPWKRKYTFLPTKFPSLRAVPAYERFTRERFLRCLDLYLAPRAIKMRLTISPEDLVPKLPSPRDLQPFPTSEALCLTGHGGLVRSVDFDPTGQYIVSGSDDGKVKVWETSTGRCLRTIELGESVTRVAWTPASGLSLIAAAAGNNLLLLNPGADIGCHRVAERTDELLEEPPPQHDVVMDERTSAVVQWQKVSPDDWVRGVRIQVQHFRPITHVAWHAKGDYIAVTLRDAAARAVIVHQISRRRSQIPFSRCKGLVQCALFHPIRAMLFVATQRVVRVYDLIKQELVRKLLTGAQWISSLAIHPAGDNLLVTSYDRKCMWFDLELSSKPYQTLRLHGGAVRAATFHKRYPLFATAGDDHNIVVSHGMVYNDLLQNPLIVPLKQLKGPEKRADLCVTDVRFHPTQPWLLAAGADNTIRLYS